MSAKQEDRYIWVMAYEVRPDDVLLIAPTPIVVVGNHTVYETSFHEELELICLNIEGRRLYFERGEQVKLNLTKTFENWKDGHG